MSRLQAILCGIGGIAFNLLVIGPLALNSARSGAGDFPQFYVGAKLVFAGRLYDSTSVLAAQREAIGYESHTLMPSRLPFYYAFLSPLARLPFRLAHALWISMVCIAAVASVVILPTRNRTTLAVASAVSFPLLAGVIGGQDVAFLLLICAVSFRLRAGNSPVAAGLVAALLLIKFHLFLPVPFLLLLRREWQMMKGLAIGAGTLVAVSFAVAGWNWPRSYLSTVVLDPLSTAGEAAMPNLHGFALSFPHSGAIELGMSLAVFMVMLAVARRARVEIALCGVALGGILLSRHAYVADCALLIAPLVNVIPSLRSEIARTLAIIALTPAPYVIAWFTPGVVPPALFVCILLGLYASGVKSVASRHDGDIDRGHIIA